MRNIKINFCDFWGHFDKTNNYFYNLLSKHFAVEISDQPDFLIYSCYGREHLKYSCYRILFNGENQRINWNACDYALSFEYLNDERHLRFANWMLYADPALLIGPKKKAEDILKGKAGFCSFVVSNQRSKKRINFFEKLSKYKKVDSGGKHLNNIGAPVTDKLEFIKKYKFNIAFENSVYPGYTTEKLFEPMLVNTIPVYWGNQLVGNDFNTASFINYNDFGSDEAVIEKIIELDNNDDLYLSMMKQDWYKDNRLPECANDEVLANWFEKIFSQAGKKKPVAQTSRKHLYNGNILLENVDFVLNKRLKYRKNFR